MKGVGEQKKNRKSKTEKCSHMYAFHSRYHCQNKRWRNKTKLEHILKYWMWVFACALISFRYILYHDITSWRENSIFFAVRSVSCVLSLDTFFLVLRRKTLIFLRKRNKLNFSRIIYRALRAYKITLLKRLFWTQPRK